MADCFCGKHARRKIVLLLSDGRVDPEQPPPEPLCAQHADRLVSLLIPTFAEGELTYKVVPVR